MRFFPRTHSRRLAVAAVSASLVLSAGAPLAQAQDFDQQRLEARSERHRVESKIESARDDLHESSARLRRAAVRVDAAKTALSAARDELEAARARLQLARVRDQQMQARLDEAERRLDQARADVNTGREAVADQSTAVETMVNDFYQQGDPELLAFASLLRSVDPADLTRELEARSVIVGNETRAYDELRAAEVVLTVREQEVEDAAAEVAARRQEAARHLTEMRRLEAGAEAARSTVQVRVIDAQEARAQAAEARRKDRRELAKLRRQEAAIQRRIDRLAERARREARRLRRIAAGNRQSPVVQDPGGLLQRPVNGPVTSAYGYRTHPIYGYYGLHDGTDFGAGCGAPLYASDGGVVLDRYYSSVWGNRLYLNLGIINGKSVVVIYNHLSSYDVGEGQRVARGQVVGRVGTTGWSTGCHLHFTVMVNGSPVDPMRWL